MFEIQMERREVVRVEVEKVADAEGVVNTGVVEETEETAEVCNLDAFLHTFECSKFEPLCQKLTILLECRWPLHVRRFLHRM